jgi:hypothetical protein
MDYSCQEEYDYFMSAQGEAESEAEYYEHLNKMDCCNNYQMYIIKDRITGQEARTACQECVKGIDEEKYLIELREE